MSAQLRLSLPPMSWGEFYDATVLAAIRMMTGPVFGSEDAVDVANQLKDFPPEFVMVFRDQLVRELQYGGDRRRIEMLDQQPVFTEWVRGWSRPRT